MSTWCLLQSKANQFIKALQTGELDPLKMSDLSSEQRHDLIAKYVGEENASNVNALYESKLLLKDQQAGMISWIKRTAGLNTPAGRDLISRVNRLEKVLDPEEGKQFYKDLASSKLGADVTPEEAKKIVQLSKDIQSNKEKMNTDFTFNSSSEQRNFAKATVELNNYVNELKGGDELTLKSLTDVGGLSKSARASMDNSSIFKQGWKTIFTHPNIWMKNALGTFRDIVKQFGGKNMMDEIMIDKAGRQNELNGNYKKMGLAIGKPEEYLPTSLPEKIPFGIGRTYKATEVAFTGFVYRSRMDIADKYIEIMKDNNIELSKKELEPVGSMVNSLTGRANMGKLEGSATGLLNNVFFSVRNVKAQFDTLGHVLTGAGGSNFVRREAAINLVKVVSGIAAIITTANALNPGSAETDPRSSDFGKIKVGDTRFDITGGMSSLVTLAYRIATQSTKSSVTGQTTPINSGKFGAKTGKDVVTDYLTNKLSPVGQVVVDLLNQKDRNENPLTVGGELSNLGIPLIGATYQELKNDPNSAPIVLAMIADALGIATNTYGQTQKTWSTNPTKTQQQFLDKVGETKFKEANDKFNTQYDAWQSKITKSPTYKKLNSTDQQSLLSSGKKTIETKVLKGYGFIYKRETKSSSEKSNLKSLKP